MTHILISWLILSGAVALTAAILPGMKVKGAGGTLIAAALFGVLNWLLGWFFFTAIGIATLGLGFLLAFVTRVIVDAIILKITDAVSDSIHIRSFGTAIVAALLIAGIGTAGEWAVRVLLGG